jgi:hypothetical protein
MVGHHEARSEARSEARRGTEFTPSVCLDSLQWVSDSEAGSPKIHHFFITKKQYSITIMAQYLSFSLSL